MPLIKNVLKPLAKSVLVPLGLTAAASATDAVIHKKMFGTVMKTLKSLDEDMNDIKRIVKSLEESGLLIKVKQWSKGTKRIISWYLISQITC